MVAAVLGQKRQLLTVFNTFCNHLQVEAVGQFDDGAGNGRVLGVVRDFADKSDVDFQFINRETTQVSKARIPRAKSSMEIFNPKSRNASKLAMVSGVLNIKELSVSSSSNHLASI